MEEYDDAPMTGEEYQRLGKKWLDKIKASEKREDTWRTDAAAAYKAYLGDQTAKTEGKTYEFNILHSNIETMVPAVFNTSPLPDIRERFRVGNETPESNTAKQVAQVLERAILMQTDDGALVVEMEGLALDALLPGRGVLRVKFDADEQEMPGMVDPMTGLPGEPQIVMANERVLFECVAWDNYREGPAQRWQDVPWIAMRHCIPWEEVERIADKNHEIKEALASAEQEEAPEPDDDEDTYLWEIWCKSSGNVYLIVAETGKVLSITPDPLGLRGFFPIVRPVQPITATGTRTPVCPFSIYRAQADELEKITRRIGAITDGLKVRGIIAGDSTDIEKLADADDNTLIPIANMEGMAATGGLEGAIAWWPVDKAIQVLRELYLNRDQCKSIIYEVTGISDIVRGASDAGETATAQQIKSQWGSLRIKRLQSQIERAARDVFVMTAELICSKFSVPTLQKITGIQITPEMQQMLQKPLDHYRIDVESDSTVRADLSRRKGEMTEFLNGTAAYFATMEPIVSKSPQMAAPVAEIFGAFARQFNLGKQTQDALDQMIEMAQQAAKQPPGPTPDQVKAQAEAEAIKEKMKLERDKLTLDERKAEFDAVSKTAELQIKREGKGADTMVKVGGTDDEAMTQGLAGIIQAVTAGQEATAARMAEQQAATAAMSAQQTAALVGEIQRGNQAVVAAMMAPKQVIRDEAGRPVAVAPVVN